MGCCYEMVTIVSKDTEIRILETENFTATVKERRINDSLIMLLELHLIECYIDRKGIKKYRSTRKGIELPKIIQDKMIESYIKGKERQ